MKKTLITVLILVGALFAGSKIKTQAVKPHTSGTTTSEAFSKSATSTWYITGTGVDSSLVNSAASESVTFRFTLNDTSSSGDSAQIKFVILVCDNLSKSNSSGLPTNLSDFVRRDSITVASEVSTMLVYKTSATTDEPLWPYYWVETTGLGDNKKLSAVSVESSISYKTL